MNLKIKSSNAPILTLAFVIIAAFFMPWFQLLSFSVSGYNLGQIGSYGNYVWLIPILAGGTIILSFFQNDIRGIAAATGIIPLLFILYAIIDQSAKDANAASTLISIFGHVVSVGAYITIICSIGIIVAAAGCGMKQFYLGLAGFVVFLFVYPQIFGFRNQDSNASENASSNDRPYTNNPTQNVPVNTSVGSGYNTTSGGTQNLEHINNPLRSGKWMITERVAQSQGGWSILWNYELSITDNTVTLYGTKTRVNDKTPTSGELRAKSIISVRLEGREGTGIFEEINHKNQKITGNVKLNFAYDWKSLTGYSFNDSEQNSTYSGHRIDM